MLHTLCFQDTLIVHYAMCVYIVHVKERMQGWETPKQTGGVASSHPQ